MIKTYIFFISLIFILIISCDKKEAVKNEISFYHWKSEANFTEPYGKAIKTTSTNKIYLHYFDIENVRKPDYRNDGIFPTYVLKNVAKEYQNFEIVPVIYITNNVLQTKDLVVADLSKRITKIINQISKKHFNKKIEYIQIDCDWTKSTKNAYFELLKELQKKFEIEVTIRLHQIKFKEQTGIPPVKKGTLMLYNVGDLKDRKQNSILENTIIEQYVNQETNYPLSLNLGLPLFSQTVVSNNNDRIKLIKNTKRTLLENDIHFKKIDEINFKIIKDTLYKGFYLSEGFNLKLEEIKENEIIASYQRIKESKLNIDEIIFYHLDDVSLSNINLETLLKKL